MALTAYCTENDVADRLSQEGIDLHTEDLPPTALGNAIERASADIELYLGLAYSATNLATSEIVNHWATALATYYLVTRNGNQAPQSIYEQAMEIKDPDEGLLVRVQQNKLSLPGINRLHTNAPRMSNIRVPVKPWMRVRVERARSSTEAKNPELYKQKTDYTDPEQYQGGGI